MLLFVSWRTLACRSVEWTTAKSTSEHLVVRVSTLARAVRLTVLAVLPIGPAILCCIHSMAGYVKLYILCYTCVLSVYSVVIEPNVCHLGHNVILWMVMLAVYS